MFPHQALASGSPTLFQYVSNAVSIQCIKCLTFHTCFFQLNLSLGCKPTLLTLFMLQNTTD